MRVKRSNLRGAVSLPPSKSHTLRAILFASLSRGRSTITNILQSPDTEAMKQACRVLGAEFEGSSIVGRGEDRTLRDNHIDAGNSGQVLRFVGACAALSDSLVTIIGDESIQTRRVVQPLLDGLEQLGARTKSYNGFAPIQVQGPIRAGYCSIDGQDSQPVSALLIAASQLEDESTIEVRNMGEKPWLALTVDWLIKMGAKVSVDENRFTISGSIHDGFDYHVPGDLSALSFPLIAALCTESTLVIDNADLNDIQGDKIIVPILQKMGATFSISDKSICVKGPQELVGCDIDVNDCIDALPILAVLGCYAKGKTRLYNGAIARKKESDRIAAIRKELCKMGARIQEHDDGLTIYESKLVGSTVYSHADHRIALSLSVAGIMAEGETVIQSADCVKKSYPSFVQDMQSVGACIR